MIPPGLAILISIEKRFGALFRETLWILGWIVTYGALMSLIVGAVSIGCIIYWARLEEANMIAAYGEEYLEYKKRMWI